MEQATIDEDAAAGDERQLVSFEVADQEYAIAIEEVQEIVQVPDEIVHVPHSRSHVLGLMTLRSRILPLVNLRRVFSLPDRPVDEKSRIVVLTLGSASVGVVVDGVREVLRVSAAGIDAMPPLLARDGDSAEITGICRLDDGKRLVSIVAASNLFDHSSVKEALNQVKNHEQEGEDTDSNRVDGIDDVEQMVVFRLDKEEFGVPIASIQEIVRVPEEMTRVPDTPVWVEGVINLRGTVLPVVDLRTRMGLSKAEKSDRQRIMVFLLGGTRTGFVVDQVAEVLRIPKNVIEPAPRLSSDQGVLLSRMANLEKAKRMIQLLDPAHLVEGPKLAELASVA
jgi:purine-binding chemotaxis protein CheW